MSELTDIQDCVDAHFHVWDLEKFSYKWPTEQDGCLYHNYTPSQLLAAMTGTPVRHAVFVQVNNNCPQEALWVCELAKEHTFIKGVVAGLDPSCQNFEDELDKLSKNPLVVGIRHILDFEGADWLARDDVIRGLRILEARGKTFDLLLRPPLLKHVPALSKELPRLKMVIDHLAKPYIKDGVMDGWADDMAQAAQNPNVFCKISGMVTEADMEKQTWSEGQFEPYVRHVLQCFGPERCMFGSDWPVLSLAAVSYKQVYDIARSLLLKIAPGSQNSTAVFRDNAVKFYGLKID